MKFDVKLFIIALCIAFIGLCTTVYANEITDEFQCSAWAEENIKEAVDLGFVPEKLQCNYTDDITRDDFCRLASEAYSFKTGYTYASDRDNFKDTGQNYIDALYDLGVVNGIGNNMFEPERPITRQEAAVILSKLAELCDLEKTDNNVHYNDEADLAPWARDSIYGISQYKDNNGISIMTGTGDGKFSPLSNCTKEQAIVTMLRFVFADFADENSYKQNDSYEICALIKDIEKNTITLDPVEYITSDDTERIAELSKQGVNTYMPNGYLIYNPNEVNIKFTLTEDTVYNFIDWGREFADENAENPSIYNANKEDFFKYIQPYIDKNSKVPFFFKFSGNNVISITERVLTSI